MGRVGEKSQTGGPTPGFLAACRNSQGSWMSSRYCSYGDGAPQEPAPQWAQGGQQRAASPLPQAPGNSLTALAVVRGAFVQDNTDFQTFMSKSCFYTETQKRNVHCGCGCFAPSSSLWVLTQTKHKILWPVRKLHLLTLDVILNVFLLCVTYPF